VVVALAGLPRRLVIYIGNAQGHEETANCVIEYSS